LKQENEKLVRENNELHQQMIRVKEDAAAALGSASLNIKNLEEKSKDMAYLQMQNHEKIVKQEQEIVELKRRLEQATGENRDPNAAGSALANFHHQEQTWAEELKRADGRSNQFKEERDQANAAAQQLAQKVQLLEGQVSLRDEEINRLNVTFQGGSSFANIKFGNKMGEEQAQSQAR
jgi:hypothetical protein